MEKNNLDLKNSIWQFHGLAALFKIFEICCSMKQNHCRRLETWIEFVSRSLKNRRGSSLDVIFMFQQNALFFCGTRTLGMDNDALTASGLSFHGHFEIAVTVSGGIYSKRVVVDIRKLTFGILACSSGNTASNVTRLTSRRSKIKTISPDAINLI